MTTNSAFDTCSIAVKRRECDVADDDVTTPGITADEPEPKQRTCLRLNNMGPSRHRCWPSGDATASIRRDRQARGISKPKQRSRVRTVSWRLAIARLSVSRDANGSASGSTTVVRSRSAGGGKRRTSSVSSDGEHGAHIAYSGGMKLGVGHGRIGLDVERRLIRADHGSVGFDADPCPAEERADDPALPRTRWLLVPADVGEPTVQALASMPVAADARFDGGSLELYPYRCALAGLAEPVPY